MHLRQLLLRVGRYLNRRFNIVSDDPWYEWADQKIDGYTDLDFDRWYLQQGKDK